MNLRQIYQKRFTQKQLESKKILWSTLYKYSLKEYIKMNDVVMDIGAGFCEFINAVESKKKIAIDIDPNVKKYVEGNVVVHVCDALKVPSKYKRKIDVVFVSNLLEHFYTKGDVIRFIKQCQLLLKKRGRLVLIQPNIDLIKEKYWNHIDHHVALNGESIKEALVVSGLVLKKYEKRYMPMTVKSLLPVSEELIRIYLAIPSFLRPFAGQSLFVAEKSKE